MKIRKEEELEKFIRENKDEFNSYNPEPDHSQLFLSKLFRKFKEVISIVPYLVRVGIATILIFIISFAIWRLFLSPPLTRVSLKYWKAEHNYKFRIHRNTRLTYKYITNPEEKAEFGSELQQFDASFEELKKQLQENPSEENIAGLLRFYKDKLLSLEEKIQKYRNRNIPNKK